MIAVAVLAGVWTVARRVARVQAAGETAAVDEAFARFWKARDREAAGKAARAIVSLGVPFDEALARLRRGRLYATAVRRGLVHADRRTIFGNFSYDLWIPDHYDPARRYPVHVQLHGGVSRDQDPSEDPLTAGSAADEGSGGRRSFGGLVETQKPREPLRAGDDRIYVLPAGWRTAPWWSRAQLENVSIILDAIKRTYNVDENRVAMAGVSDGGTSTYYFSMRDTTPYASFLPLNEIGRAHV